MHKMDATDTSRRHSTGLRQTYLDGIPDGLGLLNVAVDGVEEQGALDQCEEQQQHKGSQHSLVNAAAAQAQSDVWNDHHMRYHIDQAC